MSVHTRPIRERIDWLMDLSRRHSEAYCDPENALARRRYLAEHDTRIVVMKCMDGRVHFPNATRTPLGVIRSFRNLGGIFDLGWPYLGDMLADAVEDAVAAGRRVLIMISYHYSRGEPSRGCAGFNCDRNAAIAHCHQIRDQVERTFGSRHQTVYPLVCGFETDDDALILHGESGERLDLAAVADTQTDSLTSHIESLYPEMPAEVRRDLLPLLEGNVRHVRALRGVDRALDIEHREWAICVGRGFDFLREPNVGLIIGPYSPDLSHPIGKAAGIIRQNMEQGRIPDDGLLLLTTAPYDREGPDRARAVIKAGFLAQFAAEVITREQPELARGMQTRVTTLHWPSRRLAPVDQ